MNVARATLLVAACVLAAPTWSQSSSALRTFLFETTFDCPEWNQSMGLTDTVVCGKGDGIRGNGAWTTRKGAKDQIVVSANNPAGGGGKGFRHWVGDGLNNGGGGIVISFAGTSEMWLRYYIRFQPGFAWGGGIINMKTIYCNRGEPGTFYFGLHDGAIGGHVEVDGSGGSGNHVSNVTWERWQGGATGDGKFHVLEVHARMNSAPRSDGVLEFWLNGTRLYSRSTVHFAKVAGASFNNCAVGENHNNPQNGGTDAYVDFDDIAVSASGYIGPRRQ